MTDTLTMNPADALTEIRRRNAILVSNDMSGTIDDLPAVEAHITHHDLEDPQQVRTAEAIAMLGRAARVTLVVTVPAGDGPLLPLLGSLRLRDYAEEGQSVRLEVRR